MADHVRRGSTTRRVGLLIPIYATAFTVLAYPADAGFTSALSQPQQISTATLSAPSNPAATAGNCVANQSDEIVVSWTRTSSTWASGYEILRGAAVDGPYNVIATLTGQSTETYTDPDLAFQTTYHYQIRATKYDWRSTVTATVSQQTRTGQCA